jgi:hypothetical protein
LGTFLFFFAFPAGTKSSFIQSKLSPPAPAAFAREGRLAVVPRVVRPARARARPSIARRAIARDAMAVASPRVARVGRRASRCAPPGRRDATRMVFIYI